MQRYLVSRGVFLCTASALEGTSGAEEKLTSNLEIHTNKDTK